MQRKRQQKGQVLKIGDSWHVRYWQRRTANGSIERKRVTHLLGPVTGRARKIPPADVVTQARQYMATVNDGKVTPERIVTIGDFVERVYLPFVEAQRRPGTASNYKSIWKRQLAPVCAGAWLRDVRTYTVQGWLNEIAKTVQARNSLKHAKAILSGIFRLAKQTDYLDAINPVHDTAVSRTAAEPKETYVLVQREMENGRSPVV